MVLLSISCYEHVTHYETQVSSFRLTASPPSPCLEHNKCESDELMSWLQFVALVMVFRCDHVYLKFNPEKTINHDHNYRHRARSYILPDHLKSSKGFGLFLPLIWLVHCFCSQNYVHPSHPLCFYIFTNSHRKENKSPPYLHPSHCPL